MLKTKNKGKKGQPKENKNIVAKDKEIRKDETKKDIGSFIDDLFSKKKSTPSESVNVIKEEEKTKSTNDKKVDKVVFRETKAQTKRKQPIQNEDDDFFDSRGTKGKRKLTEEGYPIFDIKELKIGEGEGDTELCPFDCNCCF